MAKYCNDDDDAFTDRQALAFLIILAVCLFTMWYSYTKFKEEAQRTECEGVYDTFDCRVDKQIREDLRDERIALKKREKDIGQAQLEVDK